MTYEDLISNGLIPFVECDHSGPPEWTPAHFQTTRLGHLISCILCLRSFPDSDVVWLDAKDASQRHGWTLVSSEPTSAS